MINEMLMKSTPNLGQHLQSLRPLVPRGDREHCCTCMAKIHIDSEILMELDGL